jgi:hypothetical protein
MTYLVTFYREAYYLELTPVIIFHSIKSLSNEVKCLDMPLEGFFFLTHFIS